MASYSKGMSVKDCPWNSSRNDGFVVRLVPESFAKLAGADGWDEVDINSSSEIGYVFCFCVGFRVRIAKLTELELAPRLHEQHPTTDRQRHRQLTTDNRQQCDRCQDRTERATQVAGKRICWELLARSLVISPHGDVPFHHNFSYINSFLPGYRTAIPAGLFLSAS